MRNIVLYLNVIPYSVMNFNKKLTLYIVRHGQSTGNLQKQLTGYEADDPPLTELGLLQAERLVSRFEKGSIDLIFCSPLTRAVSTVKPLADYSGLPVHLLTDLVEKGTADKNGLGFPGETETSEEAFQRAQRAVSEIASLSSDGDRVLIGTHGTFSSFLIRALLGIDREDFRIKCDNASVTEIALFIDALPKLCYLNDVRHLGKDEIT